MKMYKKGVLKTYKNNIITKVEKKTETAHELSPTVHWDLASVH